MSRKRMIFCKHCGSYIPSNQNRRRKNLECYVCVPIKRGEKPSDINPITGLKICRECLGEYPNTREFFKQYTTSSYSGCYCKTCAVKIRKRAVSKNNQKVFQACVDLLGGKCNICKLSFNSYDFHHLDPKTKDVKVSKIGSLARAIKEASKCILLCANCHREVHAGHHISILEVNFKQERCKSKAMAKLAAINYKGGKCLDCGYNKYKEPLQFHHRDPTEKDFEISLRIVSLRSFERLKYELDKCDLLCANCHIKRHSKI